MKQKNPGDQLEAQLLQYMQERNYPPHASFLTQAEICKQFDVYNNSVTYALNKLEKKGYIYRIHRKGTYISPKIRNHGVILVENFDQHERYADIHSVQVEDNRFYAGITFASEKSDSQSQLISMTGRDLFENIQYIDVKYPSIKGVIFFRDGKLLELMAKVAPILEKKKIAYIFYGSDSHVIEKNSGEHLYLYKEKEVIKTGINYLLQKGHTDISFASYKLEHPAFKKREECFENLMKEKKIPFKIYHFDYLFKSTGYHGPEKMLNDIRKSSAIFCCADQLAYNISRELFKKGFIAGVHYSILGVNNDTFSNLAVTPLSSVHLPLYEDGKIIVQRISEFADNPEKGLSGFSQFSIAERNSVINKKK